MPLTNESACVHKEKVVMFAVTMVLASWPVRVRELVDTCRGRWGVLGREGGEGEREGGRYWEGETGKEGRGGRDREGGREVRDGEGGTGREGGDERGKKEASPQQFQ